MNTDVLRKIEKSHIRKDLPNFKVGDTIAVKSIIREGDKQRLQTFKGLVISIKGSGTRKTFTVRKISYGVGVEKTFPWNSTNIDSIEVIRDGQPGRSKLYYIRERVGKLALKVKPGRPAPVIEHEDEAQEEQEEEIAGEAAEIAEAEAEAKKNEEKDEVIVKAEDKEKTEEEK